MPHANGAHQLPTAKASGQQVEDATDRVAVKDQAVAITVASQAAELQQEEQQPRTIYDLYSKKRKFGILAVVATASVLVPFTDTIYLPALQLIQEDFHTNAELVAASVAIYMFAVGVTALFWGPFSDRFGRKPSYYAAGVGFLASSLVCLFSPNIGVLVAFRALQGAAVAAFLVTGSSVIADTWPPEQRGAANGMFMIPLLFGPILGPLIGGAISDAYGWRSTFIALTLLGGLLTILLAVGIPETHQTLVMRRLQTTDPAACARIKDSAALLEQPLVFKAPWEPFKYLVEAQIAPHAIVVLVTFGVMFASLTEFPIFMSVAPYSLSAGLIGVAYLPMGVAGLIGSPIGGFLSDKSAAASPQVPEARLIHNTLLVLIFMPMGLLLFGWTAHFGANLAGVLIGHFLVGLGSAIYLPGIFGYISTIKQSTAGAAAGVVQAAMFISAGVLIEISSVIVQAIDLGPWFTILAGVEFIVAIVVYIITWRRRRAGERAAKAEVEATAVEAPSATVTAGPR